MTEIPCSFAAWMGPGWYAPFQWSEIGVVYYYLDSNQESGWTEERDGTIGDVARERHLGTPHWFSSKSDL